MERRFEVEIKARIDMFKGVLNKMKLFYKYESGNKNEIDVIQNVDYWGYGLHARIGEIR